MTAPRQPLPGPPIGWRPRRSLRLERDACLILLGLDPATVHFDHQPPVQLRAFDTEKNDTIPSCYDPSTLVPVGDKLHKKKTAEIDIPAIAKTKRLSAKQESFRQAVLSKNNGDVEPPLPKKKGIKIRSRGFDGRHRPMQGRKT